MAPMGTELVNAVLDIDSTTTVIGCVMVDGTEIASSTRSLRVTVNSFGAGIMVTVAGERIISCNDGRMSQLCGTLSRPFGSGSIVTISGNKIDNPPSEPFRPEGIMTFNDGAIDLQFNEFIDREYIAPARRNGPAIDQPSEPSIPNSSATSDGNTTEFDPKVLNQREVKIDKEEVCVVCLELGEKGESMVRLTCKHVFHKGCVEKWLQESQTCPSCRGPV